MREILFTLVGIVIGYLLAGKFINRQKDQILRSAQDDNKVSKSPNQGQTIRKYEHLRKILSEVNTHGEITNDEVERKLGVSDATAERYLDELEKQGDIVQVGRTGKTVKYTRK